jgi:hypothetical protein
MVDVAGILEAMKSSGGNNKDRSVGSGSFLDEVET